MMIVVISMKLKVIGIIAIVLVSVMALGCVEEGGVKEVQKANSNDVATIVNTPKPQPTNTPLPEPQVGTYKNPAKMGETIVFSSYGNTFKISVTEVVRGAKANNEIASANMFNEKPSSGYEYALIKVNVEYADGTKPDSVSSYNFKAFSEDVEIQGASVVNPDNYKEFTTGDIMPGGKKSGWLAYLVPQNKDVIISYKSNMFSDNAAYITIGK